MASGRGRMSENSSADLLHENEPAGINISSLGNDSYTGKTCIGHSKKGNQEFFKPTWGRCFLLP